MRLPSGFRASGDDLETGRGQRPYGRRCGGSCTPASNALQAGSGALITSSTTLLSSGVLAAGDTTVATVTFSALAGDVILADVLTRTSWTAPDGTTTFVVSVTLNGVAVSAGEFATFLSPPTAAGVVLTTYTGPPVRFAVTTSGTQTLRVVVTRDGGGPAVSVSSGHVRALLYRSPPP